MVYKQRKRLQKTNYKELQGLGLSFELRLGFRFKARVGVCRGVSGSDHYRSLRCLVGPNFYAGVLTLTLSSSHNVLLLMQHPIGEANPGWNWPVGSVWHWWRQRAEVAGWVLQKLWGGQLVVLNSLRNYFVGWNLKKHLFIFHDYYCVA